MLSQAKREAIEALKPVVRVKFREALRNMDAKLEEARYANDRLIHVQDCARQLGLLDGVLPQFNTVWAEFIPSTLDQDRRLDLWRQQNKQWLAD